MSTDLQNKIHNFLINAEERHINATAVIHQGLEENPWIPQSELRSIVDRVVGYISISNPSSPSRQLKLIKVLSQFEDAFEGVSTLYDLGIIKTNKEKPLSLEQIDNNVNELKGKLGRDSSPLYCHLYSSVSNMDITKLDWKNPLASQVISDESELVNQLSGNLKKGFMKLTRKMTPKPFTIIQEMCNEFVTDFNKLEDEPIYTKLVHDGTWKESEENIANVTKEILDVLKDIWNNSAFSSEFAKTLSEGTYQSTIILPAIRASLKNLPIGDSFFISTSEKQSVASANRKGDGFMGRRPDIMFVAKYRETIFELMYVECSRLICTAQKKIDDDIKLWRECNDGLFWVRQTLKPDKDQFGIVGVQIAGNELHLNLLVRDIRNVHRYYHLRSVEIPVQFSNGRVVYEFIETLLLLRNLIITNLSLLYHGTVTSSQRLKEGSTTVTTPRDDYP
ncbi:hypothetical protein Glove_16g40 [Diversispora epigaea]|uniref:Uncharacterized protein n=1 Tax=Diversispora epigaea TaxID=1348612 RepID=A0A397JNU5_9GLOM|nr:hypothetical protein Glove_16g40 [Diversispora epigaea]